MTANGQLDPNTLRVLPGFAPYGAHDNFLPASTTTLSNLGTPAMAADYINMRAAFPAEFGILTYAEAYRSLTMQQQRWREHLAGGPLAASPGTSNHGTARAMDFRNNVGTYGSPAHQWFVNNASRFGFTPISSEGWHWEHLSDTVTSQAPATATASSGTPKPITATKKDPDMSTTYLVTNSASSIKKGIPKGWVFAVDHANGTIRHVTSPVEVQIIKSQQLEAFGRTWYYQSGNMPWVLAGAGLKRIGW